MKITRHIILIHCFTLASLFCAAQGGIEDVIIEEYCSTNDPEILEALGAEADKTLTTYRIYIDMAPGYRMQAVFGNIKHPLLIQTEGKIYNHLDQGVDTGNWMNGRRMAEKALFMDSFLTISTVSNAFCGVLKLEDEDGSFLDHEDLKDADGLMAFKPNGVQLVRMEAESFNANSDDNILETSDGCWAVLGGAEGPTEENRVLIAQITTDAAFSFKLNVQLGLPSGGAEQYVAENASGIEVFYPKLNYHHPAK